MSYLLFIGDSPQIASLAESLRARNAETVVVETSYLAGSRRIFERVPSLAFFQPRIAGVSCEKVVKLLKELCAEPVRAVLLAEQGDKAVAGVDDVIDIDVPQDMVTGQVLGLLSAPVSTFWEESAAIPLFEPVEEDIIELCEDVCEEPEPVTAKSEEVPRRGVGELARVVIARSLDGLPTRPKAEWRALLDPCVRPAGKRLPWQRIASTRREMLIAVSAAVSLCLSGLSFWWYVGGTRPSLPDFGEFPGSASSAVAMSTPAKQPLPLFVPLVPADAGYAVSHPGWERYQSDSLQYLVLRDKGRIREVRVESLAEGSLTLPFLKTCVKVASGCELPPLTVKKQGRLQVASGTLGNRWALAVYRQKPGLELSAFELFYP